MVPGVETTARFCQHQPDQGFNCYLAPAIAEELRDIRPNADLEDLSPARPWHRVKLWRKACEQQYFTLGGTFLPLTSCSTSLGTELERGASWIEDYAAVPSTFSPGYRWDFAKDYDFWRAGNRIPLPSDPSICETAGGIGGTCLSGRFWFNGKTPVGGTQAYTEANSRGEYVGLHGVKIASHYEDASPDEPGSRAFGLLPVFHLPPLFRWLPDPPPPFFNRFETRLAMPMVTVEGATYALGEEERLFDVASVLDDYVKALLRDQTTVWASAVEPSPYAGSPLSPMAIAVRADGTAALGRVFNRGNVLTTSFRGSIGFGEGPALVAASASTSSNALAPTARTEFIAVYSRAAGKLFVVGGRDASTDRQLDEIWSQRAFDTAWEKVDLPPGVLGKVVSATFSFRDRRLWLLDADPADATARRHRILRIEIESGNVEIVAATDRHDPDKKRRYERRGLLLDHDGNVILWASSARTQRHRLARIAPVAGGFKVTRTKRLPRALAFDPIADLNGFRLFYEPSPAKAEDDHDPDDETKDDAREPEVRVDRRIGFAFSKTKVASLGELLR